MTRAASMTAASTAPARPKRPKGYFQRAEAPLTSLIFLLPFIVLYELGTRYISASTHHTEQRIIAFNLLQQFFALFGATGRYLPAMAVVGILMAWHIARQDAWEVHWGTIAGMFLESFVLAIPLILMGFAAARYWSLAASRIPPSSLIVLSIGAGIYEELIFRLMTLTLLHLLLVDMLGMRKGVAILLMVLISSLLFAGYHYLGNEPFVWQTFVFRTTAGLYFGAIFVFRGFGITAGAHASYDVLIVVLRLLLAPHA
jgi:membrane protease YdiL (CAAX protease family)